ncbi:MAG: response regulator [Lachnospiraceae bacterium]|nr:response regulator [Lachnospiraceae bacterium]
MRSLYIADDEISIRSGIKLLLDWEALGYRLCGESGNGTDAAADLKALKPDLVLMDIRMPGQDGIEVIRELTESGFSGHFIILSGYSDFKYAQAAMKYNVRHYITKPIDEDELQAAVEEITAALEQKDNAASKQLYLQSRSKKEVLSDILSRSIDLSLLRSDDLGLSADRYQLVAYENFKLSAEPLHFRFSELFNAAEKGSGVSVHFEYRHHDLLLLIGEEGINLFNRFLSHYESAPEHGSPLDSIFIAYSNVVGTLAELPDSYLQLDALLSRRFFCVQGQHVVGFNDLPSVNSALSPLENSRLDGYTSELTDYIQTFNRRKLAETLYTIEEYLYHVDADISAVKLFLVDLYLRIKDTLTHRYNALNLPFDTNPDIIAFINKCNYLYEIIVYFSRRFDDLMKALGNSSRESVIDDVMYYIDHNYSANLKLEMIASLFGYNSSYLGKLFNKTAGENFNSYVDRVRINHALEMLKDDSLKVYEISDKVGYSNVDYFHKKFKKFTGESPAEYRQKHIAAE